jgi:hypothetical protein
MSDEPADVLATPEQEGTPEPQVPQFTGEPGKVEDESKPVTRSELRILFSDFTEETKRAIQSMTDKQESRLRKDLDAKIKPLDEMLQHSGLSDSDKSDMRKQAIKDEIMRSYKENLAPAQVGKVSPEAEETVKAVNLQAADMLKALGVEEPDWSDPVWKEVKTGGTAREYLSTLRATAVKVAASEGQVGRSPGMLGGSPIGTPKLEQLTRRLQEIQDVDPHFQNRELTKEREQIQKDMVALEKNS